MLLSYKEAEWICVRVKHIIERKINGPTRVRESLVYYDIPISMEYYNQNIVDSLICDTKGQAGETAVQMEIDTENTSVDALTDSVDTNDRELLATLRTLGYKQKPLKEMVFTDIDHDTLMESTKKIFGNVLKRGVVDVGGEEYYADYILKTVMSDTMSIQWEDHKPYFNGEGTVSICEALAALGSIAKGNLQDEFKHISLDNISNEGDFFNEGYNKACWGYSSPFYNLYRRDELIRPITRIELAYIAVVCMQFFDLYAADTELGLSFSWLSPFAYVSQFEDFEKLKVGLKSKNGVPCIELKEYLGGNTVTGLIDSIKVGSRSLPMPMLMSLLELAVLGVFHFEDAELMPLRQVSRGELCFLCCNMVKYLDGEEISA